MRIREIHVRCIQILCEITSDSMKGWHLQDMANIRHKISLTALQEAYKYLRLLLHCCDTVQKLLKSLLKYSWKSQNIC